MPKRYRAGLIGCGGMGRHHAAALARMDDVDLALADIMPASLDRLGDEYSIPADCRYLDYERLLDDFKPDFIVVATQAPQHAPITLAAAGRGVHILCEKPLALNLVEADAMVAACAAAGVRLAVNHLRRAAAAPRRARELIAAGEIGEIVAVDIHDKGGRPIGNTLMEMATHYIDMARFLLNAYDLGNGRRADELEWLFGRLSTGLDGAAHPARLEEVQHSQVAVPTDRDCGLVLGERGTVTLGFAGEIQAVARFHNRPRQDSHYDGVDVIGTRGSLAVRGGMAMWLFRRRGHTWAVHDPWEPVETPPEPHGPSDYDDWQPALTRCHGMLRELITAIEEGREHISSGRDGLIALEAVMAVYTSHRLSRPVMLPLPDRRHPLDVWREEEAYAG